MSRRSTNKEVISVEIIVNCIDAILACTELAYNNPRSEEDLLEAAEVFKSVSSQGAIDGCATCIDGSLLQIKVPSSKEGQNVKSIFQFIFELMESMRKLSAIIKAGLSRLLLLHQVAVMMLEPTG
jgi:hypothetical protein